MALVGRSRGTTSVKPIKFALVALFALGALAFATPAYASNSGSTTQSFGTVTTSYPTDPTAVNPCTGAPGTLTVTFHNVTHMTTRPTGGASFTSTTNGTFSFVPADSTLPSYTGHFVMWDGAQTQNLGPSGPTGQFTQTGTFSVNGQGSDGSHLVFHEVFHITTLANGTVTVAFDKRTCS
jgi:hypothetical protein